MLSCPPVICFCCMRCSAFSPLWTWSSDTVASLQKGARLILKELCSHFSAEIAMVVTYVSPPSDLKAQSTVFLRFFSDLGHEKPRLSSTRGTSWDSDVELWPLGLQWIWPECMKDLKEYVSVTKDRIWEIFHTQSFPCFQIVLLKQEWRNLPLKVVSWGFGDYFRTIENLVLSSQHHAAESDRGNGHWLLWYCLHFFVWPFRSTFWYLTPSPGRHSLTVPSLGSVASGFWLG